MEKKSLIINFVILIIIFLWLLFVGQATGVSNFSGNVNFIDEGQFAAWVSHMLHGKIMYKDIYIQYGPLETYLIFVLTKIFGSTFFIIRFVLYTMSVFLGLLIAIFLLKALKVSKLFKTITIFFLVIVPGVGIRYWIGALSIFVATKMFNQKSKLYAFVLGLLIAISGLITIDSAIFSLLTIGLFVFYKLIVEKSVIKTLKFIFWTAIGAVSGYVPFIVFALKEGFLGSFINTTSEILTSFSGINLPNGQGLPQINLKHINIYNALSVIKFLFSQEMLFYWALVLLILLLSIVIIRILQRINSNRDTLAILILIYAILIFASTIGRSGHYPLVIPFIFTVGGYLLTILFENKSKEKFLFLIKYFLLFCFLFYGFRYVSIYRYNIFSNLYQKNTINTVKRVAPIAISKVQANDITKLQKYFDKNSKPTDTIFVVNNLPALYFLLNRENSTNYDLTLVTGSIEKRFDLVSKLTKNSPKFIIEDLNAWPVDNITDKQRIPEVFDYIKKNYPKKQKIGHYVIYKK